MMNNNPIIILSSGRTGSTLLQRILNTSDNLVIWGEHDGMLNGIANSYFTITRSDMINKFYYSCLNEIKSSLIEKSYVDYNANINWLNSFDIETTKSIFKDFVFKLLNQNITMPDNKKWGFKEIRYSKNNNVVKMLIELYPNAKFLFSIRNPYDVIVSMMMAFFPAEKREDAILKGNYKTIIEAIVTFSERLNLFYESVVLWNRDDQINNILVKYEDLINPALDIHKKIFSFINTPLPMNFNEPLNFKLENTESFKYQSDIYEIIMSHKDKIDKIVGNSAFQLGYYL